MPCHKGKTRARFPQYLSRRCSRSCPGAGAGDCRGRGAYQAAGSSSTQPGETPLEILKARKARGEIGNLAVRTDAARVAGVAIASADDRAVKRQYDRRF